MWYDAKEALEERGKLFARGHFVYMSWKGLRCFYVFFVVSSASPTDSAAQPNSTGIVPAIEAMNESGGMPLPHSQPSPISANYIRSEAKPPACQFIRMHEADGHAQRASNTSNQ